MAEQSLKDPYLFDFLTVGKDAHEREIEKELTHHVEKFLLELGTVFSFLGRLGRKNTTTVLSGIGYPGKPLSVSYVMNLDTTKIVNNIPY